MSMPQHFPQPYQQPQPQFPQQGGYPQAPQGYPQPQYAAPQAYPQPQGYPQPQVPQGPPPAAGSLDAFYTQPSSGFGPALKFPQVGSTHTILVARDVTDADVVQQTMPGTNAPATFRDGRPKFVMKVPAIVQASAEHPEGRAQLYVSGALRDELTRAMAEVGAPRDPERNAVITVTMTGTRPSGAGMNPSKTWAVQYQRPNGAAPAAPPAQPAPQQAAPPAQMPMAAPPQPAQQQMQYPPTHSHTAQSVQASQPQYAAPEQTQQLPVQQQMQAPAGPPQQQIVQQPGNDLDPAQQQLLQTLLAQQAGGQG